MTNVQNMSMVLAVSQLYMAHVKRKSVCPLSKRLGRLKHGYCLGKMGSHTDDARAVHVLNGNVERERALGNLQ